MKSYTEVLSFLEQHGYLEYPHIAELVSYLFNIDIREVIKDIQNLK